MEQTDTLPVDNGRLPGADGKPGAGLKPMIAVELAGRWWDETGRAAAWKQFNEEEVGRKVRGGGKAGPLLVTQGDTIPVTPSGILNGHRFADLSKDEKLSVVRAWYAEVWAPEQRAEKAKPLDGEAGKRGKPRNERKVDDGKV